MPNVIDMGDLSNMSIELQVDQAEVTRKVSFHDNGKADDSQSVKFLKYLVEYIRSHNGTYETIDFLRNILSGITSSKKFEISFTISNSLSTSFQVKRDETQMVIPGNIITGLTKGSKEQKEAIKLIYQFILKSE